jgi:hypothetical protein
VVIAPSQECQAPGLVEVRLHPFHRCDGRGGTVQEFSFNLDWWAVAKLTVEPAMVEPVDIFGRRNLKVVDALQGPLLRISSPLNSELNASARALS